MTGDNGSYSLKYFSRIAPARAFDPAIANVSLF